MIGIVLVSHSYPLAVAAKDLAAQMLPQSQLNLVIAAGIEDGTGFGTDAMAISDAITSADTGDGVLVLVDMGSAILSTDMAFEFIDPDLAERTRIAVAPFVEGLVAAAVTANSGASLDKVTKSAQEALNAKIVALKDSDYAVTIPEGACEGVCQCASEGGDSSLQSTGDFAEGDSGAGALSGDAESKTITLTINDPVGLHARPAAQLATALGEFEAEIEAYNDADNEGPVEAASAMMMTTLGVKGGGKLRLVATGPQAEEALAKAQEIAENL